jgi:hypothetical protein
MKATPAKLKNYIGKKFGKLTVLDRCYRPSPKSGKTKIQALWRCLCECGTEIRVPSSRITLGIIKSCGCSRYRPLGDTELHRVYSSYRTDARKSLKKVFKITFEEFKAIIAQNCTYCNSPPSREIKIRGNKTYGLVQDFLSCFINGVDRIDSSKGYTSDNIVPCCTLCNMIKWKMTKEEFLCQVTKIYKHACAKKKGHENKAMKKLMPYNLFSIDKREEK